PDPRWLHSFPTRRSSDLRGNRYSKCSPCLLVVGATTALVLATAATGAGIVAPGRGRAAADGGRRSGPAARRFVVMVEREGRVDQDRKSTRLNSSHVKISY